MAARFPQVECANRQAADRFAANVLPHAKASAELQIASTGFLDPSKGISAKQGRRRLGTSQ